MTARVFSRAGFLIVSLVLHGCLGGPQVDMTVAESPRGTVSLERIPDRQFQAAHPIRLAPDLIQRVLKGVGVRDRGGLLQSLGADQGSVMAAFTEEDLVFLVPAITDALTRAAADQQVGFRIIQTGGPVYGRRTGAGVGSSEPPLSLASQETTSGRLFVYGRSIYLTLTAFRHRAEPPDTVNMPNRRLPDPTGLQHRDVLFIPGSVLQPEGYAPAFASEGGLTTLVIDQDRLAQLPIAPTAPPAPVPAQAKPDQPPAPREQASPPPGTTGDLQQIKEEMKRKETELEELRKELREIKRQLGDRSDPTR